MPLIEPQTRRGFCQALGLAGAGMFFADRTGAAAAIGSAQAVALGRKRLILFTLYGGNDGLNTVVPWRDPLYAKLRPGLALPTQSLLPISPELALHPGLKALRAIYEAGEVAIVQDVGYPEPFLSHFESIEVWDSGQPRRALRGDAGWYGGLVRENSSRYAALNFDAAVVSFDANVGFAAGNGVPLLRPGSNSFAAATRPRRVAAAADAGSTARRLAEIVNEGIDVEARFAERLRGVAPPHWATYDDPLAVQIKFIEWFVRHGVRVPMFAMAQGGYDTHTGQLDRQGARLAELDAAIARLRDGLIALGAWDDTVVLVHSEFGRRVAENNSGGTDHGTAGPVLLIGGKVGGGVFGRRARLDALDSNGNLAFTTDYRQVYATIAAKLWDLAPPSATPGLAPLALTLA